MGNGVVQYVREGGSGGEAYVNIELRSRFPGIGKTVITSETVLTACRIEHNNQPGLGKGMYLRHALLKKLDDLFFRSHRYSFPHIPRPFGSTSIATHGKEAHIYEWAHGIEGFPWEMLNPAQGHYPVDLADWNQFKGCFAAAGIDMGKDTSDDVDGRTSKNIIHEFPRDFLQDNTLSQIWKRIDYGQRSLVIDYHRLITFLEENKKEIAKVLREERLEMMLLMSMYLATFPHRLPERELGRLEMHIEDYRKKTLMHFTSRGMGHNDVRPHLDGEMQRL